MNDSNPIRQFTCESCTITISVLCEPEGFEGSRICVACRYLRTIPDEAERAAVRAAIMQARGIQLH